MTNLTAKDKKDTRQFCAMGAALCAFLAFRMWHHGKPNWPYAITAAVVFLIGVAAPIVGRPLFAAATKLTQPIGWSMTRLILTTFFVVVLTPAGIVTRLVGHDPLRRKPKAGENSMWLPKTQPDDPKKQMEMQF